MMTDNKLLSSDELYARMGQVKELNFTGAVDVLYRAVDAMYEYERARVALTEKCRDVADQLRRQADRLEEGDTANPLGILQGRAGDIDRMVAELSMHQRMAAGFQIALRKLNIIG